jgi:hypothetical protein
MYLHLNERYTEQQNNMSPMFLDHHYHCKVNNLKSAMLGKFTSRKLSNPSNQGSVDSFSDCVDVRKQEEA